MQNYFSHYCFYFPLEETGTQNSMKPFTIQFCLNGCRRHCHIKSPQNEERKQDIRIQRLLDLLSQCRCVNSQKKDKMTQDEVIPLLSNHNVLCSVWGSSSISLWPHLQLITSSWKCSRLLDLPRLLRLKSYWTGSKLLRLKWKQAVMLYCKCKREN